MAAQILPASQASVKSANNRWVSPYSMPSLSPADQVLFDKGREAYMNGKRLTSCATKAEVEGWLHQEGVCADAYFAHLLAEADETPSADREWIRRGC